jgi:hypothetical protein
MEYSATKPKLLFFQYRYDERLPAFVLTHMLEHVRCLSQFFDVTVVNEDCDYVEMCDRHEPDLTLVEGSFTVSQCHRPRVTNVRGNPQIPKVGFLHSDGFSQGRAGFISDMDYWDIDTFFTISVIAAEHTPAIADRLFVWPNFVDPAIFQDYQQWKSIPVLFTGNSSNLYPWRQNVIRLVSKYYPSLICPHPGMYDPHSGLLQVIDGEPYARMLNASWFVPTCGTVARDVVRKHFEVPACKACLITERSAGLEAAGFVDLKNCVFADEKDILDKLGHLFQHRDQLETITEAGYQLVHSRHTMKQRNELLQWFSLRKRLKGDQKIIQPGPFEALSIVDKSAASSNCHVASNGEHLTLLRQGNEELLGGRYEEATSRYFRCLNYIPWMPEPQFRLALSNLYKGNAKKAESWILEPLQFTFGEYNAIDPDPVEWAYFIVCALCHGKVEEAKRRSGEFPWLRHSELDRVRLVVNFLGGTVLSVQSAHGGPFSMRASVHQVEDRDFREWIHELCIMLRACGQGNLAERVMGCQSQRVPSFARGPLGAMAHEKNPGSITSPATPRPLSRAKSVGTIKRRLLWAKAKVAAKQRLAATIRHLEANLGAFLPYRFSAQRCDVFFNAIEELAQKENIRTALVIGADRREPCTEALLTGATANENRPAVFCIANSLHGRSGSQRNGSTAVNAKWYELSSSLTATQERSIEDLLKTIKHDAEVDFFDLVLVDGSEVELDEGIDGALANELRTARFVLLDDISSGWNHDSHWRLLKDQRFILANHNPTLRNGYSIFEKPVHADDEEDAGRRLSALVTARIN